jgi:hypothetical protein
MSELSIDELQAETGELLPERETLGTIIIGNVGEATAIQHDTSGSFNLAINHQSVNVVGSFNHHHTFIFAPSGGII